MQYVSFYYIFAINYLKKIKNISNALKNKCVTYILLFFENIWINLFIAFIIKVSTFFLWFLQIIVRKLQIFIKITS